MPTAQRMKWRTFGVATLGLTVLQGVFAWTDPAQPLSVTFVRTAVLIFGAFLLNTYVFGIVQRSQLAAERRRQELDALLAVGRALAYVPTLERQLAPALESVGSALGADLVAWMEFSPSGNEVYGHTVVGQRRSEVPLRFGRGSRVRSALEGSALAILEDMDEADAVSGGFLEAEGIRTMAVVPVSAEGGEHGGLLLLWRNRRPLTEQEQTFLHHARTLYAVASENLRLWRENRLLGAIQERQRIAAEMHDGLAQVLTYLKLRAETVLEAPDSRRRPQRAILALQETRQAAVEALGDVRQVIMDLRHPLTDQRPFTAVLRDYLRDWSAQSGVMAALELPQGELRLPDDVELHVLRIVQEALANVRKHAAATSVHVRVSSEGGVFEVRVSDDGVGFDQRQAAAAGHFGLSILVERAEAIGGRLAIVAQSGYGTEVVLRVPEQALSWVRPGDNLGGDGLASVGSPGRPTSS